MAELNVQFVRPDKLLSEGPADSLVLVTYAGELGVWPGHAAEIVALGDGVVRVRRKDQDELDVIVSGGYAEISDDEVIILADHARRVDDIDVDVVRRTRDESIDAIDGCGEDDHRRAYYENKVNWCNLLLKNAQKG